MGKEHIFLLIIGNIQEVGLIINQKEKAYLLGLMEENMKVNIKIIKKKDLVFLNGQMEKNIKEIGKMEGKKGKENFIFLMKINGKKEFGVMEKG